MPRFAVIVAALLLAGCTSSRPTPSPTRGAVATPAFTTCGSFLLRATTAEGTWPLLSCAALANVNPLPWVRIRVGEKLQIHIGEADARVALRAGDDVAIHGLSVTGLRAGNTLVTIGGWSCAELAGPPPALCPLLRLTVG
ncbi:MAG TPA: hypothetical protein VHZ96_17475 [Frankiaceae bacterium]|nr:hypothetical protein [Frankiaceae bacterium]